MADAISVTRNGHQTFSNGTVAGGRLPIRCSPAARIIEGMRLGASVEVDLVIHADNGMAVLHNLSLERETTGTQLVRETSAAVLRELHLRDNAGQPIADKVMLLEDLAALIARDGAHPDGLLQLDFKEDAAALNPAVIANFAEALGPVARHFILSSGDAEAVRLLSQNVPEVRIGYDPCRKGAMDRLLATRD